MLLGGSMDVFARWDSGREYIRLLLSWRWLVFAIGIPLSLVIELIEEQGPELDILDEVLIDGIVLPVATWFVLTFVARKMAAQVEREAALERRQQFTQRLSEHREYHDLANFLVRFPASLVPVQAASLWLFSAGQQSLQRVAAWHAVGADLDAPTDLCLVLIHDNAQLGVLNLVFQPDQELTPAEREQLLSYTPDIAAALAHAIADHEQAERAYRDARAYERRRITQELHDSLAQQVFYLHLNLDQLTSDPLLARSEGLQGKLTTMREVAADVYEQIRNNLSILRAWEQVNLTEAIADMARVCGQNAAMRVDVVVQGEPAWLSPHVCEQVYSVVREALNNVVKHARAAQVKLSMDWSAEELLIRLMDNGVGFNPQLPPAEGHYGLSLMRETMEALHGELEIESAPGQGTGLTVRIPIRLLEADLRPSQGWPQQLV